MYIPTHVAHSRASCLAEDSPHLAVPSNKGCAMAARRPGVASRDMAEYRMQIRAARDYAITTAAGSQYRLAEIFADSVHVDLRLTCLR